MSAKRNAITSLRGWDKKRVPIYQANTFSFLKGQGSRLKPRSPTAMPLADKGLGTKTPRAPGALGRS